MTLCLVLLTATLTTPSSSKCCSRSLRGKWGWALEAGWGLDWDEQVEAGGLLVEERAMPSSGQHREAGGGAEGGETGGAGVGMVGGAGEGERNHANYRGGAGGGRWGRAGRTGEEMTAVFKVPRD